MSHKDPAALKRETAISYIMSQTGCFTIRKISGACSMSYGRVEDLVHTLINRKIIGKAAVINGEEMFRVIRSDDQPGRLA